LEKKMAASRRTPPLVPRGETHDNGITKALVVYDEKGVAHDLTRNELSECQEESLRYQRALDAAYDAIDNLSLKEIQRLEAENKLPEAELSYMELIQLKKGHLNLRPGLDEDDDIAMLKIRCMLAEVQISQNKFAEAAKTARYVREKATKHLGEDFGVARVSLLKECRALRFQGNAETYIEAEKKHRRIWLYSEEDCDKRWRVRNGVELALVVAEQGRFEEAAIIHSTVVEKMKEIPDMNDEENSVILDSRQYLGKILAQNKQFDSAVSVLNEVWIARKSGLTGKRNESIAAGELLAMCLNSLSRWKNEEVVRRWIRDVKLENYPANSPEVLESHFNLGNVLVQRKKFGEAVNELGKVWRSTQQWRAGNVKTLEAGHFYSQALVGTQDYVAAEPVIRYVWIIRQRDLREKEDRKCILESGHLYGIVLLELNKLQEAEGVLRQVGLERQQIFGIYDIDALESLHAYGKTLLGQDDVNLWETAESILSETWNARRFLQNEPGTAYDTILEIGYFLALCLRRLKKYGDDLRVIEEVCGRKAAQLGFGELGPEHKFSGARRDLQIVPINPPPPPPPRRMDTSHDPRQRIKDVKPPKVKPKISKKGKGKTIKASSKRYYGVVEIFSGQV
jgi:predicted negative regulator of RcsB-dependent stress response